MLRHGRGDVRKRIEDARAGLAMHQRHVRDAAIDGERRLDDRRGDRPVLAEADAALVTACLLHDLGHLLNDCGPTPTLRAIDDRHQYFVVPFLRGVFGDAVIEPIRLHVDAKRYLAATEPDYLARLSPDSLRSLRLQGGVFTAEEARRFQARPFAEQAVQLRRFDDLAKCVGRPTPPLDHFLAVARTVARRIR